MFFSETCVLFITLCIPYYIYILKTVFFLGIYSCVPCGSYLSFYDSLGNLNEQRIDEFLGDRKKVYFMSFHYCYSAKTSLKQMLTETNEIALFSI